MAVSFELPEELEKTLRNHNPNLDAEARESFLVALYRSGRLSHLALSQSLGLDRFETEDLLYRHHVTEDLGTLDDYLADADTLKNLRSKK